MDQIVFEKYFSVFYFVVGPSLYAKLVVMGHQKAWKLPFLRSHSLAGDREFGMCGFARVGIELDG
jgi:hypothetical protein